MKCPVTDEEVMDVLECRDCRVGRWYGCPVRQEIEDAEAYFEAGEASG